MTSKGRPSGYRVPASFQGVDGPVLLEQSRAIDKKRLVKRLRAIPPETPSAALEVL